MPIYNYTVDKVKDTILDEDQLTIDMIIEAENEDMHYVDGVQEEQVIPTNIESEEFIEDDSTLTLEDLMALENNDIISEETIIENELPNIIDFIKHEKQVTINLSEYQDYDTLFETFYSKADLALVGSDLLDVNKLSTKDMTISKEDPAPQILIFHTHSQEAFADSIENDPTTTIVGVGENLAKILEEQYGYSVLHHTDAYDLPERDKAYKVAEAPIEQLLKDNPTIEVVIDLHRDAVNDGVTKLVTDIDGRPTAKFMLFNGISRSTTNGNLNYLNNPNLESNLAFSFQMKIAAEEYYPGLTRKNYLQAYRYNMHFKDKYLLIELGAQTSTVEEVMNACDPIAHILDIVLSGQ